MSFGSFVLLPNITGAVYPVCTDGSFTHSGMMTFSSAPAWFGTGGGSYTTASGTLIADASASNSIYGKSDTVQPNSIVLNYIIKY